MGTGRARGAQAAGLALNQRLTRALVPQHSLSPPSLTHTPPHTPYPHPNPTSHPLHTHTPPYLIPTHLCVIAYHAWNPHPRRASTRSASSRAPATCCCQRAWTARSRSGTCTAAASACAPTWATPRWVCECGCGCAGDCKCQPKLNQTKANERTTGRGELGGGGGVLAGSGIGWAGGLAGSGIGWAGGLAGDLEGGWGPRHPLLETHAACAHPCAYPHTPTADHGTTHRVDPFICLCMLRHHATQKPRVLPFFSWRYAPCSHTVYYGTHTVDTWVGGGWSWRPAWGGPAQQHGLCLHTRHAGTRAQLIRVYYASRLALQHTSTLPPLPPLAGLTKRAQGVRDVCFSNDGRRFLSTGYDKNIRLWDTETGQCIKSFNTGKVGRGEELGGGPGGVFV